MSSFEIVLETTKPETEWVRGRAVQKVSPTYLHGLAQLRVGMALTMWAERTGAGRVASEWRFRITPPGEVTRPLVPDVAFVSYDRLPKDADAGSVAIPLLAPSLAVEITSPDNRLADILDKVQTYLKSGTDVVLIVDPLARTAHVYDPKTTRVLNENDAFEHAAFPSLNIPLAQIFRE